MIDEAENADLVVFVQAVFVEVFGFFEVVGPGADVSQHALGGVP
jgi:hypothetical protein